MSNRTLPYGYCYKNGIIAIESKESKVLKRIFSAYLNGDSMLTIAEQLNREKIEYASGVIGWNKGRLKHLIDNPRYLGTEVYPQIIEQATYEKIQKTKHSRNTQKDTDKAQEIFRLTVPVRCPICGSLMRRRHDSRCKCQERWTCENKECRLRIEISDAELLTALSDLLSTVTADSISLPAEKPYEPSTEAIRLNNEISRMLDAAEIDKAILRNKMTECISQKYSELGNECCTAHKLKAELGSLSDVTERLNRTVSEIRLHPDKTADLILLNGQIIRKEKIHATDSGRSTEGGAGNRTDHIGQGEHQKPLSSLACCSILQKVVMTAIMETANQNTEVLRTLKLHIGMGLEGEKSNDNSLDLQVRIAEIDAEFRKMIDRVSTETVEAFDEETATRLMNEKSRLQQQLDNIADAEQRRENAKSRLDDIYTILDGIKNHPIEYDDQIVRQLLECIVVDSKEQVTVIFKGGLKSVQPLTE